MKKIFTSILLITGLALAGCTSQQTVDYKGISFKYPSDLTVSYNNFEPFRGENIDVQASYISDFMSDCVEQEVSRGGEKSYHDLYEEYSETLKYLRDNGINNSVENLESLTCGYAGSNLSSELIKIDGINGVIFHKVTGNSGLPSLSTYFTQVLLVGPENQVYSVVFNYEFGDLGQYIRSIKDEFGEAILDESESYKYDQVYEYLAHGNPIKDPDVAKFEDNQKVINDIINSINIKQ